MVEANEAVARLLDSLDVPFLRRTHPEPDLSDTERLRQFVQVAGHKLPKELDRKAIQALLASVQGQARGVRDQPGGAEEPDAGGVFAASRSATTRWRASTTATSPARSGATRT